MIAYQLGTDHERHYDLPARAAVIASFAQVERGDWNTWDYEAKYGALAKLTTSGRFWTCGDWTARVGKSS